MHNTDKLADFFLNFAHLDWVVCFFCIGLLVSCLQQRSLKALKKLLISKSLWYRLAFLCALSMIVNVALKGTFKVPLHPSLGKIGYAFPSGHMQFATVFYGFLALAFQRTWFYFISGVLLIGIGFGLMHYHFHTLQDLIAGFIVGGALLWMESYTRFVPRADTRLWFAACLLMIYNMSVYKHVPKHAMISFLILTGLTALSMCYGKKR